VPVTTQTDPRQVIASLRPQGFGKANAAKVKDPICEPLWIGVRALAAIDSLGAVMTDEAGGPIVEHQPLVDALAIAARSDSLVVDGFLTKQVVRDTTGIHTNSGQFDDVPSTGRMLAGSMVGLRRDRSEEAVKEMQESSEARTFDLEDEITFVAIDLLWLDGQSLLDIPLLERRRLLEAVLEESDDVRRGAYRRPPINTWVSSLKAQGFTGVTFKAANSRYQPGVASPDWAIAPMPRR
jgi:hypothetical protein